MVMRFMIFLYNGYLVFSFIEKIMISIDIEFTFMT